MAITITDTSKTTSAAPTAEQMAQTNAFLAAFGGAPKTATPSPPASSGFSVGGSAQPAPQPAPQPVAQPAPQQATTLSNANGSSFTVLGANADGTVNVRRSDGAVFNGIDRATAAYYGIPQNQIDAAFPKATAQPAASPTQTLSTANGAQFTILGTNADGTINLRRSDGQTFNSIDRATAAYYGVPAEQIAAAFPPAPTFSTANGAKFTVLGVNADGTVKAQRSDGEVFTVDRATAQQYGVPAAQVQALFGYEFGAPKPVVTSVSAAIRAFAGSAWDPNNPGDTATSPFGSLPDALRAKAEAYAKANGGLVHGVGDEAVGKLTPHQVLNGIGLSDDDIRTLASVAVLKKAGDPTTDTDRAAVEQRQQALMQQLPADAYAAVAAQARQTPQALVEQMAWDLARYGISDLAQVGVTNIGGQDVYFNKATGQMLPASFGSDMSGKGGKYFKFIPGENGQAVPVPSWSDTSNNDDIRGVLTVALAAAAPFATAALGAGGLGLSGAASGAIIGGTSGAALGGVTGIKDAVKGGVTGAIVGGAGGALSDYVNGTGAFSPGQTVTPNGTDWQPFLDAGMSSEQVAQAVMFGNMSETQIAGLLNQGFTGAQIAKLGMSDDWQALLDRGMTSEEAAKATMFGDASEADITRLLDAGYSPGQIAAMAENGSLQSVLAGAPSGGALPKAATAGGSAGGSLGGAGGALGTGLTAKELIGLGLTGAGAIGKLTQDTPDAPDLPGTGSLGGGVGGADFGAGGAVGSMQAAADRDQQIRTEYADKIDPYLADWLKAGSEASKGQAELAGVQRGLAEDQAKDYRESFAPVNKALADEALRYGKTDDQERQARKASQSANEQTNAAVEAANQQLADMGVDASSGRFFGTNLGARIKGAASAAGAANAARESVRDKGVAARTTAAGVGLNLNQQAQAGLASAGDTLTKSATSQAGSVAGGISTGEFKAGNPSVYMEPAKTAIQTDLGLQGIKAGLYRTDTEASTADSAGWGNLVGVGLGLLTGKG